MFQVVFFYFKYFIYMECKGSEFLIFSFFPQIQPILKKRADVDQDPEHWLGEESFRHKAFLPSILNKQCDKKKVL